MKTRYVLLTSARNEEADLETVIASVLRQTVRPLAWFIMDDGSSDRTASIVEQAAASHPFIRLSSTNARGGRNFGSKDKAITAAYALAKSLEFDFVGVLDADTAFAQENYCEAIFEEFDRNERTGIVSGYVYERPHGKWESREGNAEDSVPGIATFRRECFEQTGGYTPLYYGGADWLIQLDAKMAGWEIKTRPDLHILHYRPTSSAGGILRGMFRAGLMDASFGSDPVFELFKCGRRLLHRPLLIGGLLRWWGYFSWKLSARQALIPAEKVEFLRNEQRAKLRRWMDGGLRQIRTGWTRRNAQLSEAISEMMYQKKKK
jgi:poly-beta-1,6-N-acetyl-D-glucosamine synthase